MKNRRREFSKRYATFEQWNAQAEDTEYARRIRRLHALYPNAILAQLSGRARDGEIPLGELTPLPLWQLPPEVLSPREKGMRRSSLEAISKMRETNGPLSAALADMRISVNDVLKHAGGALRRGKGDYYARAKDDIPRSMKINYRGREIIVVVDSENASIIGAYHAAIKRFLNTGERSTLEPFAKLTVVDTSGNRYYLDADPHVIQEIEERREEPEFYTIYSM